jgi:hypothetical protein|tara:strand:+ start:800 stop:1000 length:201 start_codon:yes stop_codon:yes gene_type:complete
MSADKRLYEVKVNVTEEKIYHVYADDERDLREIWEENNFKGYTPVDVSVVSKDRRNYRMIKNKENL